MVNIIKSLSAKLPSEIVTNLKEYDSNYYDILDFYRNIGEISIDLLQENGRINAISAEKLAINAEFRSEFLARQNSFESQLLCFENSFSKNPQDAIIVAEKEAKNSVRVHTHIDNLHEDIVEFYFRKHMGLQTRMEKVLKSFEPEKLSVLPRAVKQENSYSQFYYDKVFKDIKMKTEELSVGEKIICHENIMGFTLENIAKNYSFFPWFNKNVEKSRAGIHHFAAASSLLELIYGGIELFQGKVTPFFHNLEAIDVYYPKSHLSVENLELLLSPGYVANDGFGRSYKVVKLKAGDNKDERSKIKSKIMVEGDTIFLKYIAFGIWGRKVDVVFEYNSSKSPPRLLHLDYSGTELFCGSSDTQFKTFGDERKFYHKNGVFNVPEVGRLGVLGSINDVLNPLYIDDGKGGQRFNFAAIGGEALLETDKFIVKNYSNILQAARCSTNPN